MPVLAYRRRCSTAWRARGSLFWTKASRRRKRGNMRQQIFNKVGWGENSLAGAPTTPTLDEFSSLVDVRVRMK